MSGVGDADGAGGARWIRDSGWTSREVADRRVLVPITAAMPADTVLYVLDGPVAALLWDRLVEARSEDELAAEVVARFLGVEPAQAAADVRTYLTQLEALGAIRRAD